ncbi:hypothetical protein, partial [uncultured Nostoc sp.]
ASIYFLFFVLPRFIERILIFYIFTVTLLYSDVGLVGSIGFHLAGDIYPFMRLKYEANNYKKRRREKRRAKYVSN